MNALLTPFTPEPFPFFWGINQCKALRNAFKSMDTNHIVRCRLRINDNLEVAVRFGSLQEIHDQFQSPFPYVET